MIDWMHDNVNVNTIRGDEHDEFVVDLRDKRVILTEREADALMGELSASGVKNPNRGRYNRVARGDVDE